MKMTKRILSLVLVVLMAFSVLSLVACSDKEETEGTYVIGLSGPLTGGAAVYGQAVKNSAELAVEEINANGGLNGIKFVLVATDDQHDASKIANNYSKLMEEDKMQVSLGTVTTAPGKEFKKLAKEDNVLFLTPSATGDDIPEFANGFQMCFSDSSQGTGAALYVNENYAGQTIGVFFKSDDPYSTGILNNFKAALDSSITLVEASFNGEASAFDAQVQTLKNCQFIFMPIYYTPAYQFMVQAKDEVAPNTVYYGCDGLDGIQSFDLTVVPQEISYLSHFNSNATEGPAATYIQKYKAKYGEETLNQFGASAYDCVYAIYGAMKHAIESGKEIPANISASALCEILKAEFTGGVYKFSGVTGTDVTWTTAGLVQKSALKYVVKEADPS